jgi:hypothetical protein
MKSTETLRNNQIDEIRTTDNQEIVNEDQEAYNHEINKETAVINNIPFNVSTELDQYSKVFISKEFDNYRLIHCFEFFIRDYKILGELPDGDKKILFTAKKHFQCCNCLDDCSVNFCCCCEYMCCDRIVFQMDYKRNNKNFYTQGYNIPKGLYFCKCTCCPPPTLYLRENINPDNKDINVGIKKGKTTGISSCFDCLKDKTVSFTTQDKLKGAGLRMTCLDFLKHQLTCLCCHCFDIDIAIENGANVKIGNITVPNGWFSKKVKTAFCFLPGRYFEVNFPPGISSEEKFQIIADLIHFDILYMIL